MLVKVNFGSRRGEIQDIAPAVAKVMLADGRATWPTEDQHPSQLSDISQPVSEKPRKRRRRGES